MGSDIPMLAISPKAGETLIREYDLYVESNRELDDRRNLCVADRVVSAHAPISLPGSTGWRVHIASTIVELRERSTRAILAYIEQARQMYPHLRHINMHTAPHQFPHPPVRPGRDPAPMLRPDLADWDLLVEAIREIARRCRSLGLTLSVENNWAYWDGIDPTLPLGAYDPAQFVEYYGTSPDEWLRLAKDVNEPNVSLCLDPSHAVPYAHRWPVDERGKVMDQYLVDLGLLGHLHWNDSDLYDPRGRDDLHLPVGTGTLGEGFHRALKGWARETGRIALLEHFVDRASLERELAYIAVL